MAKVLAILELKIDGYNGVHDSRIWEKQDLESIPVYNHVMHVVYCEFTLYFDYKLWLLS